MSITKKTKQPSLEERLLLGLSRVGQAIRSQEQKRSFEGQLSPTQIQALMLVSQGTRTPSEIAQRLGVSRASLSDSLSSLVDKKLLRKKTNPEDSRSTLLELSAKGKKRAERLLEWPESLLEAVGELSSSEKSVLLRVVSQLIVGLQERELISVPRMCGSCRFFRRDFYGKSSGKPHHCDYVGASFADGDLRLECAEHEQMSSN